MRKKSYAFAALALLPVATVAAAPARPAAVSTGYIDAGNGVRLYYEKIGSGPKVVLVPFRIYLGELRALARPDRTLILYDVRNRGASSRVERDDLISVEADLGDVETIRRWAGAKRVSLIGYSYGGMMVAAYALRSPEHVDRLVQLGPGPIKHGSELPSDMIWKDKTSPIPAELGAEIRKLREQALDRTDPRAFCLRFSRMISYVLVGDPRNASRFDVDEVCRHENEWPDNFARHVKLHFEGSVPKFEISRDNLRALRTPVLTFHGTRDRNAPFASGVEWDITLPNARFVPVIGAAHQSWLEDPRIVKDIDTFLAGGWPSRARKIRSWNDARKLLPDGTLGS